MINLAPLLHKSCKEFNNYLRYLLSLSHHLNGYYKNGQTYTNQKVIGSIFPQNLVLMGRIFEPVK